MTQDAPRTIVSAFCERVRSTPDRVAIYLPREGDCASKTWSVIAGDVRRAAAVVRSQGVAPGDRVILLSPNRYEWIVCDLAIQMARAVNVPVHASLSGAQIAYQVVDSGAKLIIVSGPDQAAKLDSVRDELPKEIPILSFDACEQSPLDIWQLGDLARHVSPDDVARVEADALANLSPDDLATILYTSGTTGEPKGVMLTQNNLLSNAIASQAAFAQRADDRRMAWLPLSHIFARTCDLYIWILAGSELVLADAPENVVTRCREHHPTLINAVPYFYEKIQRTLVEKGLADTPGALQATLGGRMRACCSGGAPLPLHVAEFFEKRGLPLLEGYGLTESSPVITMSTTEARKNGSVGRPAPGVEVRIADDGEILARGPNIMRGYWKKDEATAATVRDAWLYTGDLGRLDDDGFLWITGRKKELIVTSGGKNIAPVYLEALLVADPLIQQAVVVGDRRPYLAALIVPDLQALDAELRSRGLAIEAAASLSDPRVQAIYAERINQRLAEVSHYERVQKFALLEKPFAPTTGELTLTMKLRRNVIHERYGEVLERLYRGEACALTC